MPVKESKQLNTRRNLLVILPVLFLLLLVSYIVARFTVWKPTAPKDYKRFYIDNQESKYKIDTDFTLENELNIKADKANFVYKSEQVFNLSLVKDTAAKLGLSKQTSNNIRQIYLWSKDVYDDKRYIKFDQKFANLELRYSDGISKDIVTAENAYQAATSFLSMKPMQVTLSNRTKADSLEYLQYRITYEKQSVWAAPITDTGMNITLNNGLIVGIDTFIFMPEYQKERELKPVTLVSRESLSSLNYAIDFYPDATYSSSSLGSESTIAGKVKANMVSYKPAYFYYYDTIESTSFLLPAIQIEGRYIDERNAVGTFSMIVINQVYDANIK